MKRVLVLILVLAMLFVTPGCKKNEASAPAVTPQITQMKNIFELSVMECYFHNVAKYFREDTEKGLFGLSSKDTEFWIEYNAMITLGIDVSKVSLDIQNEKITITLPPAQILSYKVEPLDKECYYVAKDSAKVTAEDEVEAFKVAEEELVAEVEKNRDLLASAQARAKKLLESYLLNISNIAQKSYEIEWIYLDANGNQTSKETQIIGIEPTVS